MNEPADNMISDLSVVLASYEEEREKDPDLSDIHSVAAAAIEMLSAVRAGQLARTGSTRDGLKD